MQSLIFQFRACCQNHKLRPYFPYSKWYQWYPKWEYILVSFYENSIGNAMDASLPRQRVVWSVIRILEVLSGDKHHPINFQIPILIQTNITQKVVDYPLTHAYLILGFSPLGFSPTFASRTPCSCKWEQLLRPAPGLTVVRWGKRLSSTPSIHLVIWIERWNLPVLEHTILSPKRCPHVMSRVGWLQLHYQIQNVVAS